ncbi:MAG: Na+/H+ antiporter subunit E [Candidatus Thermoplasmatota archaeon]|nr:Na+/H+ antiporter subunit E [Candidatus Thermoplasmatota archaeon]MBU1941350.1 Na+/H+ antiporter subunit E [Candidatus Thermoplasmatota archaeon]
MLAFTLTTIICFIVYLMLTTGSGTEVLGLWSYAELLIGAILSIIVGFVARTIFIKQSYRMLNPVRWILFLVYLIGPFFYGMAKANFDVAYRVITGKINPGIVKISPNLKTDLGISLLANSITLTPGTLSVDIDEKTNDLYIHWINVKPDEIKKKPIDTKYVCGNFDKWVRRITE